MSRLRAWAQEFLSTPRVAWLLVAGMAALAVYRLDVTGAWLPKCPVYVTTGWHCPGCGSTRAVHALFHADVARAMACNAVFVCAMPLVAIAWLHDGVARRNGRPQWNLRLAPKWIWLALALALLFMIVRNLPHYPFNLLSPH